MRLRRVAEVAVVAVLVEVVADVVATVAFVASAVVVDGSSVGLEAVGWLFLILLSEVNLVSAGEATSYSVAVLLAGYALPVGVVLLALRSRRGAPATVRGEWT